MYSSIIDVVHVHGCHLSWHPNSKDQSYSLSVVKIANKDRVGKCADTWYKRIEPTEIVELCWPGNLPSRLCETDQWVCVNRHRHNIELTTVPAC